FSFEGATMPAGVKRVYAKWSPMRFRVILDLNASDATFATGGQAATFRVDYLEQIQQSAVAGATRPGYSLAGWYLDPDFTVPFSFTEGITDQMYGMDMSYGELAPEDKHGTAPGGVPYDDSDKPEVRGIITIYAAWRKNTDGAAGVTIIYQANGGTFSSAYGGGSSYTDPTPYQPDSQVYSIEPPTPPAPTGDETQKTFAYWVIQRWDETSQSFVDTDEFAYIGAPFTADKDYARELIEYENDGVTIKTHTYTMQLRAEYKTSDEEAVPTHIYWYGNGNGQTFVRQDENLQINDAVAIPARGTINDRTGYDFKGWYKKSYSETEMQAMGGEVPTTYPCTEPNFIWYANGGYYSNAACTASCSQVAADEWLPYDNLYAVWAPHEYDVRFNANAPSGTTASGSMDNQHFVYGTAQNLTENAFTVTNYVFKGWATSRTGGVEYTDKKEVMNLTAEDGAIINLYAVWEKAQVKYTVEHYLLGMETKVADDTQTPDLEAGTQYTPNANTLKAETFYDTYAAYTLTANSTDPAQAITITTDGGTIKVYYTLPLTITATTASKPYDGTALAGSYTQSGALPDDADAIITALGTAPSIGPDVSTLTYTPDANAT
ncbi:MAG: InlB B-repeat-containing protein, partial [Clostridia bacterium]|nr:InlB B-repeat-containing protein [Clostridia bacterium]